MSEGSTGMFLVSISEATLTRRSNDVSLTILAFGSRTIPLVCWLVTTPT